MTTISIDRQLGEPLGITFLKSLAVGIVLTTVSYLVALLASWITELNWLEVAAVFTSYVCTYLGVKQRRINYLVAVVTTSLYFVLFLQFGLLSSAVLQAYLVPTVIIGWFWWKRDSNPRPVMHVKPRWMLVYIVAAAIVYVGAVFVLGALGANLAFLDSIILALTVLAQFLMDRKKIETWIVWAVVNIVAIYVYFTSGLPLVGLQYVFFLGNAVYGWQQWHKTLKANRELSR